MADLGLNGAAAAEEATSEYRFFPIEKVIVSLKGENREHYFVLDLVLQADLETDPKKLEQIDPMVRNSVVAHLSAMTFETLRGMLAIKLFNAQADRQSRFSSLVVDAMNAGIAIRKLELLFAVLHRLRRRERR